MATNNKHPLQIERERQNYSQPMLAEATGISLSTIKRIESGRCNPSPFTRSRICKVLGKNWDELGLPEGDDNDMNRRKFVILGGKLATLAGMGLAAGSDALARLAIAANKTTSVDVTTLAQFAQTNQICWAIVNGSHFVSEANSITQLLATYLPQFTTIANANVQDKDAAHVAAQGYMIATLIALDGYNVIEMDHNSALAIKYATVSGDTNLVAAAHKQRGDVMFVAKRTNESIRSYQAALSLIERVSSPLLRSSIYQEASNIFGHTLQTHEALRYIGLARDSFPNMPEHDPCANIADCNLAQLYMFEGDTYLALGNAHAAWESLSQVDGLNPKIEVGEFTRLAILKSQARTAITLRDLELASQHLEVLITNAAQLQSQYGQTRAAEVYDAMRLVWPGEPHIAHLGEMLHSTL